MTEKAFRRLIQFQVHARGEEDLVMRCFGDGVGIQKKSRHVLDYPVRWVSPQVDEGHFLWHNPQNEKAVKRKSRFAETVSECGRGQRPQGESHIRQAS